MRHIEETGMMCDTRNQTVALRGLVCKDFACAGRTHINSSHTHTHRYTHRGLVRIHAKHRVTALHRRVTRIATHSTVFTSCRCHTVVCLSHFGRLSAVHWADRRVSESVERLRLLHTPMGTRAHANHAVAPFAQLTNTPTHS